MASNQRFNVYVTFVEKEGPFLKFWGQTDKSKAIFVEQFLSGVTPQFDAGVGKISTEHLVPGLTVCVKYHDNKYYRAKVLNAFVQEGFLEVNFIDFGNKETIACEEVRSFQSFLSSVSTIPPLAVSFIIAEAHCVGGGKWNDATFDRIAKEIKYRDVQCTLLAQATHHYLVRISVEGIDICHHFIQKSLMQPIPLQAQQAVLLSMSMQKQSSPQPQESNMSSSTINTYKACTLKPGLQYPVYVSYVNDGPCRFSVQLKNTEDVLVKLMNEINSIELRALEETPLPGTICLARCQEDNNICRAVVTTEVDTQFRVFFVDFGNYEVLPADSLFQIPFKYVLPKVMAIRFCLAGVEKPTVTIDMQIAFKKFVDNRLLHMKVLPSPTKTALPKCELRDPNTNTSALEVVMNAAKHSYPDPLTLTRGFSQPVKVTFVYSCNRFYVQLANKENELRSLMDNLQELCQDDTFMDSSSIKPDVPCCALFVNDGLWYRSQVVDVKENNVKVRYIDYGNEELIPISQLKDIDSEVMTVLRPQAIECCLNGYQNMEPDEIRDGLLEELILEQVFTMKVVEMCDQKALVDLFDESNYNVASLLLDKLAAANSQMSPVLVVQAGHKLEHRKSYSKQREVDVKDKPGRDKPNERTDASWRQDNRDNRNFDRNTNENNETNSWRQNNKGFSPNSRLEKYKNQNNWNNNENKSNSSSNWNSSTPIAGESGWSTNTQAYSDWGDSNDDNKNRRNNDYKSNRGGFNNRGGRGGYTNNRDRGDRGGSDSERGRYRGEKGGFRNDKGGRGGEKFGGKSRGSGYKQRDFKKDGSDASSTSSGKSFHRAPKTSSRSDQSGWDGRNNDKPKNSFKDHSGGGDSWEPVISSENSWNVSTFASSIDAAPVAATFVNYDVVGIESKVVISWFHNPGLFYCQVLDDQEQFKSMMQDIHDFYKDRKPERVVQGSPVIGLFPEDNVLYRAKVLDVIDNQYKVQYVDYGNVSTISKVWPIDKKFMNLPAQAVTCCLNNIAPVGDQWDDPDCYCSYFDKENFTCKFVNKDEEKTFVNLTHNSEDVAQLLVKDGLAISTALAVPEIEIPLLLGQQFRAIVKSVNNLSDIILALECGLAVNCTMHNLETATETFEETLKGLLEQTVIIYVDNVLQDYRLEITLYDTQGNKHIILNPDEGSYDTVDIPCPLLVLCSTISGNVTYANENSIFIQPVEVAEQVAILLDQLFAVYDGKPHESTIIPEEGMVYAVHSEDGNWYRGKVTSFDDEKATVYYIDYGNYESVNFSELRELEVQFLDISILSLQVKVLSDAKTFIDKDVTASIYYGETGWEGTVQIINSINSQILTTDSTDNGFATSSTEKPDEIVNENLEIETSDEIEKVEVADGGEVEDEETVESEIPKTEEIEKIGTSVVVSHIDSPCDFYLQYSENLEDLDNLQTELQETLQDMEVLVNPTPGVLCAAPYTLDQMWYRAEVLDADEDITTVRFVDFGNTDVIDNKTTQIKTLPPKLLSLAIYATRCSLKIEPVEEDWNPVALGVFETLTEGALTAEFCNQDEKCTFVELYSDGINIKDALVSENLAKFVTSPVETKQTGFVSHLNSPSEFWIQLESCIDELEWIAERLSTAENFPELTDLTPGTLCAALFPEDQMWYRARILSNTIAGVESLFIDYGNSCTSTDLKQLPEDLIMTAPLAIKCSLQKNEGIPTWTPEAAAKFAEISAEGQTIFTVKKISSGETSVVQLYLDDKDVTTMLLPNTEDGYITKIETLKNMSLEKENGETIDDVALEPMEGQKLDETAKEKLEELNEQGSTLFQIEFVNEKTIRLYLQGRDIRPLLGGFINPAFNPLLNEELTNVINKNENIEDAQKDIHICDTKINISNLVPVEEADQKIQDHQNINSEEELSFVTKSSEYEDLEYIPEKAMGVEEQSNQYQTKNHIFEPGINTIEIEWKDTEQITCEETVSFEELDNVQESGTEETCTDIDDIEVNEEKTNNIKRQMICFDDLNVNSEEAKKNEEIFVIEDEEHSTEQFLKEYDHEEPNSEEFSIKQFESETEEIIEIESNNEENMKIIEDSGEHVSIINEDQAKLMPLEVEEIDISTKELYKTEYKSNSTQIETTVIEKRSENDTSLKEHSAKSDVTGKTSKHSKTEIKTTSSSRNIKVASTKSTPNKTSTKTSPTIQSKLKVDKTSPTNQSKVKTDNKMPVKSTLQRTNLLLPKDLSKKSEKELLPKEISPPKSSLRTDLKKTSPTTKVSSTKSYSKISLESQLKTNPVMSKINSSKSSPGKFIQKNSFSTKSAKVDSPGKEKLSSKSQTVVNDILKDIVDSATE
ncbi:maternal protein tudor-like [Diorhabda sublineata]|uniref:maternal protein tudor-like n=1 Tax=Diorhabda sublineata TaxID=1163346 RepID=UPI0024E0E166|nr:maternal protein tudor-like [Diorhabda sublineata]